MSDNIKLLYDPLSIKGFFSFKGKRYIRVFDESYKGVSFDDDFVYAKDEKSLNNFTKSELLRVLEIEIKKIEKLFNNLPDYKWKVRCMKTRWGVCNTKTKTITLNTELIKKDLDLIDYVIVHEMCHFYHGNHSEASWNLVGSVYPEYKEARKRLKEV